AALQFLPAPPGLVLLWKGQGGRSRELVSGGITLVADRGPRWPLSQFDLHIDARGKIELHQRVDRLRGRLHDVEQPLVRPHLELLARLLVDVRRAVDGELLDARRKGNGTADESTRAPRRIGDVASRLVEHSMIERLQAN